MATDRTVSATWNGSLLEGAGTIHAARSGTFGPLAVSWAARAEEPNGKTSPEELIAAAHAACFAMALSHGLAQSGTPADQLDTSATVTFQPGEGIIRIVLTVRGSVPGIDAATFAAKADEAKAGCPVSKALAGVPEITLDAALV
jgi:osmotically inducible protein OsmC